MSSRILLATALLATAATAGPLRLIQRDGPDNCAPTIPNADGTNNDTYVADIQYFADSACTVHLAHHCAYAGGVAYQAGGYDCQPANAPTSTPYYAQLADTADPSVQLVFTADQSCPPSGPGAVFATLVNNKDCVEMNRGGSTPGLSVYPNGGAQVSKKRDNPGCTGFTIDSQQESETASVQISSIVDCTNGASSGCSITEGQQHTSSVTTMYSATAGGSIEGLFDVSATFGMSYEESDTTSIMEGFSVQQGQKGYLSAYSEATLFKGTFTGCKSGDANQPGTSLVVKVNGFTYEVVNTGA